MPRKYQKKKSVVRRRPRRTRYRRRRIRNLGVPSGIPTRRRVSMRYCEAFALTCTSGVLTSHLWSANSVYDPNVTGTGHQPISYDSMSALYNHYTVVGAKIRFTITDSATSHSSPGRCGVYLTDAPTPPYVSGASYIEAKKGAYRLITGGQRGVVTCTGYYSPKQFFNIKDIKDNRDTIGSSISSNPTENAYFLTWYEITDGSTNAVQCQVVIDYIVDFSEPRDPLES